MGNKITDRYFDQPNLAADEKRILDAITTATHFQPEKEIFRGQIYDANKVGSLIYRGTWDGKPTVLKIQGLRPDIDEIDIIERFIAQNESAMIRLPTLYAGSKWNESDGYGYLLLEYVDAPRIYEPPFADAEQQKTFCAFYQEYKSKCLRVPLFEKEANEYSSLVFTTQRVSHWAKIAQSKKHLSSENVKSLETFLQLAGRHLPSIHMEFMHGHLTYDDIFKVPNGDYVLMSNLFWSYRPEYYDAVFHLWAGIKSIRDAHVTAEQVILYLESWKKNYQALDDIANDKDFERKFNMMFAERCIGALLVDIQNQRYESNRDIFVAQLQNLFRELFSSCCRQLE